MTYLIRPHESDCEWREGERVTDEMRRDFEVRRKGDEIVKIVEINTDTVMKYGHLLYRIMAIQTESLPNNCGARLMIEAYSLPVPKWAPAYHWLGADADAA